MTPPKASRACSIAGEGSAPSAAFLRGNAPGSPARAEITVLQKRADFLKAARARRKSQSGLLLQARHRDDDTATIRLGFTCSKKIGNAVARNRAKRRLRAIARETVPHLGMPGWDYVLVGRPGVTTDRPFAALRDDLEQALRSIHADRK